MKKTVKKPVAKKPTMKKMDVGGPTYSKTNRFGKTKEISEQEYRNKEYRYGKNANDKDAISKGKGKLEVKEVGPKYMVGINSDGTSTDASKPASIKYTRYKKKSSSPKSVTMSQPLPKEKKGGTVKSLAKKTVKKMQKGGSTTYAGKSGKTTVTKLPFSSPNVKHTGKKGTTEKTLEGLKTVHKGTKGTTEKWGDDVKHKGSKGTTEKFGNSYTSYKGTKGSTTTFKAPSGKKTTIYKSYKSGKTYVKD